MNFYMEVYEWRGVPETDYLSCFWRSHARVPQASHQTDSILTCCQEQKPQEPTRTSWPQEKGLEKSALTHARHTHCTTICLGTANRSMTFFRTDFEKRAMWQGSIEKPAVKVFVARKVRTNAFWQSVRNQLECKQVQRALEKASGSCLLTSNNEPFSRGQKSIHESILRLYCVDLVEAYVTQEDVSSRISREKVWFVFTQRKFAWETFTEKGKMGRERRY